MFRSAEHLDEFMTRPPLAVVEAVGRCPGGITVLGAGGKMGFHLSQMLNRALRQAGQSTSVVAVSRFSSPETRRSMEQHGIQTLAVDLSDPDQLSRVPQTENVFFLAGVKFGTGNDSALLQRMNVEMPELVAQHFARSRIVALSTGCVYSFARPESGGSMEEDPLDPPGPYAQSCIGREQAFVQGSRQHGTPVTLVRLNYAIDLRYGVLLDIAQKVLAEQPVEVETGYVNVIWQGDAVAQIIQCLSRAASPPTIVNVTGPETLSVRALAEGFGRRFEKAVTFAGRESEQCWLSNSRKARQWFGEPAVRVEQMMDWIADWLLRGGETLGKPTQFENRAGTYR